MLRISFYFVTFALPGALVGLLYSLPSLPTAVWVCGGISGLGGLAYYDIRVRPGGSKAIACPKCSKPMLVDQTACPHCEDTVYEEQEETGADSPAT